MKTLVIIPSRLSATRLPGKPLLKINGLSIISHVFKKAEEANIGEVFIATEDQEIIKNNLKKWKKDKDSNNTSEDKNINNVAVDIDLNEIESTIGDSIDLDEMGSILDGKTVKSFISDSTFKNNKDEIINNIKKIIPKSYTKSEKSNNSVNDIELESHVHC